MQRLLSRPGANAKLTKGNGATFRPYILHLAPARSAGERNVCPDATPECISLCLNTSGLARVYPKTILGGRIKKTREYFRNRPAFIARLIREIGTAVAKEAREGKQAVFRLNGTSDLDWTEVIAAFPSVQFYDYTKSVSRYHSFLLGKLPQNYHLVFSFSGRNQALCQSFLARGGTVAVAFARPVGEKYVRPAEWSGFPTIDGDVSDLRFLDPRGSVIALKAKGAARRAKGNSFVIGS